MSKSLGKTYQQIENSTQESFNFMPAARQRDPEPSHVAAEKITESGARQTHCERILQAVRDLAKEGWKGVTGKEIAAKCGLDFVAVMRRLNDLRNSGELVKGAERVCRVDGKTSLTTWWMSP